MALKATIFKTTLQVADMDRNHFGDHELTIARHPSETDQRMMLRILAFALNADERLAFTRGISSDDEPDLWQKSLSDEIELWIELGQPDEKRLRRACGRATRVLLYCYNRRSAEVWWQQQRQKLARFDNLAVYFVPDEALQALAQLASRNMQLQCTVQERVIWLGDADHSVQVEPVTWRPGG